MRTIVQQLRDAYLETGWTMEVLVQRSGLDIDRSALRRKLMDVDDPIPMKTGEAEALAKTFGCVLVFDPGRRTKARVA